MHRVVSRIGYRARMPYTPDQIMQLRDEFLTVDDKYLKLLSQFESFTCGRPALYEYALHGFMRRLGTLRRCAQNVYSLYTPERTDVPSQESRADLVINLQAFVFNVFGCFDNLAWIWVKAEGVKTPKGKPLPANAVGLRKEAVLASYPVEFRDYLAGLSHWFEALEDYRHALAHRIPLYVPPFTITPEQLESFNHLEAGKLDALRARDLAGYHSLDAEQEALGTFLPVMTHSPAETRGHIYFHAQVLADWNTVVEVAEQFLQVFDR